MGKRISQARIMRKKAEKLKLKAKKEILRDYPKLMADPEQKKKVFEQELKVKESDGQSLAKERISLGSYVILMLCL